MTNPFGVEHEVSKASGKAAAYVAQRTPAQIARLRRVRPGQAPKVVVVPVHQGTKAKKGGGVGNAVASSVAGTLAGAAVRYGAPAAAGAAGGALISREQRRRERKSRVAKAKPVTDERIRQRKKVQGALGMTAAGLSTAAFGSKTGSMLLPKLVKAPAKAAKYKQHLDRAATVTLFGASGIGGASGLHQSRVYQLEGQRKLAKAYDPEKRRMRRLSAYEAGAAAGAAGLAGSAAYAQGQRAAKGPRKKQLSEQSRTFGQRSAALSAKATKARSQKKAARPLEQAASTAARSSARLARAADAIKVPRGRTVAALAGGSAAAAGTSAALHRYRHGDGQPYKSWFDRDRKVRKRLVEEPAVAKAMPDGMDLMTRTGQQKPKRRRLRAADGTTITYC